MAARQSGGGILDMNTSNFRPANSQSTLAGTATSSMRTKAKMPDSAVAHEPDRVENPAAGLEDLFAGKSPELGIKDAFSINIGVINVAVIPVLALPCHRSSLTAMARFRSSMARNP